MNWNEVYDKHKGKLKGRIAVDRTCHDHNPICIFFTFAKDGYIEEIFSRPFDSNIVDNEIIKQMCEFEKIDPERYKILKSDGTYIDI